MKTRQTDKSEEEARAECTDEVIVGRRPLEQTNVVGDPGADEHHHHRDAHSCNVVLCPVFGQENNLTDKETQC